MRRDKFTWSAVVLSSAALLASPASVLTQTADALPSSCVSLRGSTQCPAFQDAYINPSNLTQAWPWMDQVKDVESFDQQFALYWTDPYRFRRSQINVGLQCNRTGAANTTIQYERTVYCGQFTQISYSAQCNVNVEKPTVVCQSTCQDYAASEQDIVSNAQICAPTSILTPQHNATRAQTLAKDYATCTNWTSLVSNNTDTCIQGQDNEGNCGYGPNVSAQLCQACDPTGNRTIPSCCTASNTDLSQCERFGHLGAAQVSASSSAPPSNNTGGVGSANEASSSSSQQSGPDLSGGQLAGILVGSIIGALLLGALIAWLLFGRKRRNGDTESGRGAVYGTLAATRGSSGDKPWNSEDHMSRRSMAGSPEMEKTGGAAGGSHTINMMALGAGSAAAAAGGGAAAAGAAAANRSGADRASSPVNRPISEALTTSSGGDKGATVASVRDQYTGQDIHVGEEVMAIYPYNASLNDELTLEPEQRVTILRLYDDGWALGRSADGSEGALPLVCVSSTKGDVPGRRGGNGTSTGTSDDEGLTSGNEYTSSVDGAVTAEEGGFTSDGRSQRSRR